MGGSESCLVATTLYHRAKLKFVIYGEAWKSQVQGLEHAVSEQERLNDLKRAHKIRLPIFTSSDTKEKVPTFVMLGHLYMCYS